jgi:hypothetical protein
VSIARTAWHASEQELRSFNETIKKIFELRFSQGTECIFNTPNHMYQQTEAKQNKVWFGKADLPWHTPFSCMATEF